MSLRRVLATFLLLPLIAMLESGAWYAHRSVLFLFRMEEVELGGLGMSYESIGTANTIEYLVAPVIVLAGGVLAAAMGAQGLLVLGLLVALPGMALLGASTPWMVAASGVVLLVGHSLLRPSLMATAASATRSQENLRTALVALVYGGINLGALLGSHGGGLVREAGSFRTVFAAGAVLIALALLTAVLLGGATLWTRAEVAAKPVRGPALGGLLLGGVGMGALVFLPWLGLTQVWNLAADVFSEQYESEFLLEYWTAINPALCILTALMVAALAGVLHLVKRTIPAPLPMGLGLLLLALGLTLVLVAYGSPWLAFAGMGVAALGEVLLMVFFISRLLGDLHWRLVTLMMAVWLAATQIVIQLLYWLDGVLMLEWWHQAWGWTSVVASVLAAIVLAAVAVPAQRKLWSPEA
jgi:dipeptide/tripeptide permease